MATDDAIRKHMAAGKIELLTKGKTLIEKGIYNNEILSDRLGLSGPDAAAHLKIKVAACFGVGSKRLLNRLEKIDMLLKNMNNIKSPLDFDDMVAKQIGCSSKVVGEYRRALGLFIRSMPRSKLNSEKEKIEKSIASGMLDEEMAATLNISPNTFEAWRCRIGIRRRISSKELQDYLRRMSETGETLDNDKIMFVSRRFSKSPDQIKRTIRKMNGHGTPIDEAMREETLLRRNGILEKNN